MSAPIDEVPYEEQTSLFRAIGANNWDKALNLLQSVPHEARIWTATRYHGGVLVGDDDAETIWYRRLPLHHACRGKSVPVSFIQSLIQVYPEALLLEDEAGRVPLIHACRRDTSLEVVQAVLNPETATKPDKDGKCALHWACEYRSDKSTIQTLVETAPSVLQHRDVYGRLPLHWECSVVSLRKEKMAAVSYLLEQYPEAVSAQDHDGHTPLHMIDVNSVFELLLKTKASLEGTTDA